MRGILLKEMAGEREGESGILEKEMEGGRNVQALTTILTNIFTGSLPRKWVKRRLGRESAARTKSAGADSESAIHPRHNEPISHSVAC